MDIRKDKFLASLMALGLATGAAACGGSSEEATEEEAAPMTTGGDTMAEPDPMMDTGMDEEPMDDMGGDDMGAEEDLGPTPE